MGILMKERCVKNMENKKKKFILLGIGSLIGLFLVIGISYAIWQLNLQQTNDYDRMF